MKIKHGVIFDGVVPEVWYAAGFAAAACQTLTGKECVVTSFRDGVHGKVSLHYSGKALDIRTRHLSDVQARHLTTFLKQFLSPMGFDVVLEHDHIHIEFQPRERQFIEKRGLL